MSDVEQEKSEIMDALKKHSLLQDITPEQAAVLLELNATAKIKVQEELKEDVSLTTLVDKAHQEFVKLQIKKVEEFEVEKLEKRRKTLNEKKERDLYYHYKSVINRCVQLRMDKIKKRSYPDLLKDEEDEKKKKEEREASAKKARLEAQFLATDEGEKTCRAGKYLTERNNYYNNPQWSQGRGKNTKHY